MFSCCAYHSKSELKTTTLCIDKMCIDQTPLLIRQRIVKHMLKQGAYPAHETSSQILIHLKFLNDINLVTGTGTQPLCYFSNSLIQHCGFDVSRKALVLFYKLLTPQRLSIKLCPCGKSILYVAFSLNNLLARILFSFRPYSLDSILTEFVRCFNKTCTLQTGLALMDPKLSFLVWVFLTFICRKNMVNLDKRCQVDLKIDHLFHQLRIQG